LILEWPLHSDTQSERHTQHPLGLTQKLPCNKHHICLGYLSLLVLHLNRALANLFIAKPRLDGFDSTNINTERFSVLDDRFCDFGFRDHAYGTEEQIRDAGSVQCSADASGDPDLEIIVHLNPLVGMVSAGTYI